jgi:hypothetical protein
VVGTPFDFTQDRLRTRRTFAEIAENNLRVKTCLARLQPKRLKAAMSKQRLVASWRLLGEAPVRAPEVSSSGMEEYHERVTRKNIDLLENLERVHVAVIHGWNQRNTAV